MPPKKKMMAPIDRPLSRAYLRKFSGWSTAYPPGSSDPTSLRLMENMLVNRDGSIRTRPGLRLLSREQAAAETKVLDAKYSLCGTMEPFYSATGEVLHLAAMKDSVRNYDVVFRVLRLNEALSTVEGQQVYEWISLGDAGFDITAWSGTTHAQPTFTNGTDYVKFLQIDNKVLALSDNGEPLIVFYVGETKKVPRFTAIADPVWGGSSRGTIDMPSKAWINGPQTNTPTHAVDFSSTESIAEGFTAAANPYNFAFVYTFSNDLGETAPSDIAQFKVQRAWGSWSWYLPDPAYSDTQTSTPGTTLTTDASKASDQLSLLLPNNGTLEAAVAAGATKVNFYVMSWSNQSPVPVELVLVGSRTLVPGAVHDTHGWFMLNPSTLGLNQSIPIPTAENRVNTNTTEPPRAGQGLVAADRLVLVNDPTKAAVIRWTTNAPGENLNLASSRGGGFKTLTSGDMQIPACVKLWQNPQSVDTLTILNAGTDGTSTTYYMAPSTVTSQSDNTNVMGFEETTSTLGTVSPYGCEVANNALYHPLDDQLMKSTASNYNINHKAMTDMIANMWLLLENKEMIVSCFHDQRLYYLVHNPDRPLEGGTRGNEVWVLDLASEGGSWSRWLTGGVSLRKMRVDGELVLTLIRPEGVYFFDDMKDGDDVSYPGLPVAQKTVARVAWKLETNTQGANRAHDAWSHLQQANLVVGNFRGRMRYGVRGRDRYGQPVEVAKVLEAKVSGSVDGLPWDVEDYLLIKRDMKEWFFFAESTTGDLSAGQITLVQYRYAPISVNDGYEYGSVETFEYGRELDLGVGATTTNGIPQPFIDTSTP